MVLKERNKNVTRKEDNDGMEKICASGYGRDGCAGVRLVPKG